MKGIDEGPPGQAQKMRLKGRWSRQNINHRRETNAHRDSNNRSLKNWTPLVAVSLIASLMINAFLLWRPETGARKFDVQLASPDRIEVIRTHGGLLQVSTIKAPETFQANKDHQVFGLVHIGQTITQIRVPAVYHYHVELAREWKVNVRDKTFIVIAPVVKPTLPIAIDTANLQGFASGTWSILTGQKERNVLQRSITQTLAVKASSPSYINLQREVARTTVHEFVQKWLITQEKWGASKAYTIKVYFEDEPIGSMRSVLYESNPT